MAQFTNRSSLETLLNQTIKTKEKVKFQEIIEICEDGLSQSLPKDIKAFIWFTKGIALEGIDNLNEALEAYEQALILNTNRAILHYNKGWVLQKLKKYQEAIASYDLAIKIDSRMLGAWYNKGNIHYTLGREENYKKALEAFKQVQRLNANFAEQSVKKKIAQLEEYFAPKEDDFGWSE